MSDSVRKEGGVSPSEAFALLGNETRVAILRALLDAERRDPTNPEMTFADLHGAVGTESTSRFSYHLTRLTEQFVRPTDDGYTFTRAGWEVTRAILRGTYEGPAQLDTARTDATCADCGGELVRTYERGKCIIECGACEGVVTRYPFPRGGFENRTSTEQLEVFDTCVRHELSQASDGVCPACLGPMETSFHRTTTGNGDDENPQVRYDCERCGNVLTEAVEQRVLRHPAVVSFCHERGIDRRENPHWQDDGLPDRETTVLDDDPPRIQVTVRTADDSLSLTIHHDLTVDTRQE